MKNKQDRQAARKTREAEREREREMSKKEKCHKRDETGSKSDCLSVFFSLFSIRLFSARTNRFLSLFCALILTGYLFFSLSLPDDRALCCNQVGEENKLTIGWLSFSSSRLLPGLAALISARRFFFLSFFLPTSFPSATCVEHSASVSRSWRLITDHQQRTGVHKRERERETMPDYTPIVRQGHWSAVTIPNGSRDRERQRTTIIFFGYYHLRISARPNSSNTFVRSRYASDVSSLVVLGHDKNNNNGRPRNVLIKRARRSVCYCRPYETKANASD